MCASRGLGSSFVHQKHNYQPLLELFVFWFYTQHIYVLVLCCAVLVPRRLLLLYQTKAQLMCWQLARPSGVSSVDCRHGM